MLNSILIDAGPLIALFDSSDKHHAAVKAFLKANPYRYVMIISCVKHGNERTRVNKDRIC